MEACGRMRIRISFGSANFFPSVRALVTVFDIRRVAGSFGPLTRRNSYVKSKTSLSLSPRSLKTFPTYPQIIKLRDTA